MSEGERDQICPKYRPDGLHPVHLIVPPPPWGGRRVGRRIEAA